MRVNEEIGVSVRKRGVIGKEQAYEIGECRGRGEVCNGDRGWRKVLKIRAGQTERGVEGAQRER